MELRPIKRVMIKKRITFVVMGMIHSGHRQHKIYNAKRIQELIQKVNPDYVLTEIPPDRLNPATEQFRQTGEITESRVRVFPEYTEALYPLTKTMDFEIIPCAAWTKEMKRQSTGDLGKTQDNSCETICRNAASSKGGFSKHRGLGRLERSRRNSYCSV